MISIIKYNGGNTQSLLFALERLNIKAVVSDDPEILMSSEKIIFPGVGEASSAMNYLKEKNLDKVIKNLKQPVLGICLGLQLLCSHSEENNTDCLGIIDAKVKRFKELKVPHMGWNQAQTKSANHLFEGIKDEPHFYFVHSYYVELCSQTTSETEYGIQFSSTIEKGNFYGVQFHPEKSAEAGLLILENFLKL